MQELDKVDIETEFMKGIISRAIENAIKKYGYDVKIQISNLAAVNEGGEIYAHLRADAKTSNDEFKRICNNSALLKNTFSWLIKILNFKVTKKFLMNEFSKIVEKILKEKFGKVDLDIKDFDYSDEGKKSHIHLNAHVKMKEKEMEKVLMNMLKDCT